MKIKFFIVCFAVAFCSSGHAQIENDSIVYSIKTEYIEKFPNRITARALYTSTFNSYVFYDRNSDASFTVEPNKQNKIGASVSYSFITLAYTFAPDFMAENRDNADSKLFNLHLRAFFGKWTQSFEIFNQKGFYETVSGIYAPDLNNLKIGGSTSYIFNDRFSYRSISNQDERQVKSAGSFLAGVNYYYNRFNLFAEDEEETIDENFYFIDFAFTPGYHYNFVPIRNMLLSAGGIVGIGLNHTWGLDETTTSLLTLWSVSGTATYDIENLFFGADFNYLSLNHNSDDSTYTRDNISHFQLFIGYRFKAPKKWVRSTEKIKKKLHL